MSDGKWSVAVEGSRISVIRTDGTGVCRFVDTQEVARRIVACVNACAGIATGALEAGLIRQMLDAAYGSTDDAGPGDGPDDREA